MTVAACKGATRSSVMITPSGLAAGLPACWIYQRQTTSAVRECLRGNQDLVSPRPQADADGLFVGHWSVVSC